MVQRSAQSLRFEEVLRIAAAPGALPRLADIDFSAFGDLAPWIAALHPDRAALTLKFVTAGAGIARFLGRDPAGMDYLEMVDPAIKGDAFDSAFVMLSRPCGLWQITPGVTTEGETVTAEYTGFPVFDVADGRGLVLMLIHQSLSRVAQIMTVQHSTEWAWLEMRGYPLN